MKSNNLFRTGLFILAICFLTGTTTFAGSSYYGNDNSNTNTNTNDDDSTPSKSWWWQLWYWWHHNNNNNDNTNNNNHDDDDDSGNSNNNNHDDDDDGNYNNNNHDDDDDSGNANNNHDDDDDGNYNNNNHDDDDDSGNANNNNHDDDDDGNYNNNNHDDDDDGNCHPEVTEFILVHDGTAGSIGALHDGIKLNDDCDLNIKALVSCQNEVGSVEFILNYNTYRIENDPPYALAGNSGSSYYDMNLPAGSYHLKAIPWSGANGTGTPGDALEVHFYVVDVYGNRTSACIIKTSDGNNNNNDDDDDGGYNNNNNDDDDDGGYNNNNNDDDDDGGYNNNNNDDDDDGGYNNNNNDDDDDGGYNNNNNDDDDDGGYNNNNNDDDDDGGYNNNNNDDDDDGGYNNNNNTGCNGEVTSLTLVRGGTSSDIDYLHDWYVVDRDCGVNIRANVSCESKVRSVVFILNGAVLQVENSAPYSMGGDLSGVYKSLPDSELPVGNHHLKVVPWTGSNGTGHAGDSYELWFTVIDNDCEHYGNNNNNDDDDDNGNNNNYDDDDDNWNNNNNHDDDDDNGNSNNNNYQNFKMSGSNVVGGEVVRVFPNPTDGEFDVRLALNESSNLNVRLFDVSGKLIMEETKNGFTGVYNKRVDLRQQAIGIYFLSVNVNGNVTTQKILYSR